MNQITRQKLAKLREYYFDDNDSMKVIEMFEKRLKSLVIKDKLASNSSVKLIVKEAKKRINVINQMLSYTEDLTESARQKLFAERDVHLFYLKRLDAGDIDERFDSIDNELDVELKNIGVTSV